jgi:hypothetical protein
VKPKQDKSRPTSPEAATPEDVKRRRVGRIVRDDRDNASVEWVAAPDDYDRVPLSIEATLRPNTVKTLSGYNPYETITPARAAAKKEAEKKPVKRDLRRLSEWIKQMRDLEERKKRGED